MFLSARFGRSNRRRMTDLTVDSQFCHQLLVKTIFIMRSGRFDAYTHRIREAWNKTPSHFSAFVRWRDILAHNFSRRGV